MKNKIWRNLINLKRNAYGRISQLLRMSDWVCEGVGRSRSLGMRVCYLLDNNIFFALEFLGDSRASSANSIRQMRF